MHSPFNDHNEDLMRQDRKAERMTRAAWLLSMVFLLLTVVALKYAHDLNQVLQPLLTGAGAG